MIFNLSQGYVPESYYSSRDFRVFLKLLNLQLSTLKTSIDNTPSLYSAEDCPDNLVPLLCDMVGLKYNNELSIYGNRLIVKYYPYLIKYRGSKQGIKLAVILSLNLSNTSDQLFDTEYVVVNFDYTTGLITIYAPEKDSINSDLIEVVRPIGSFIEIISSSVTRTSDNLDVQATVDIEVEDYHPNRDKVEKSKVGFSGVSDTTSP